MQGNSRYREDFAQFGGWFGDYLNTELVCWSGRWLKPYDVVNNSLYIERGAHCRPLIENFGGRVNELNISHDEKKLEINEVSILVMFCQGYYSSKWDLLEGFRCYNEGLGNLPRTTSSPSALTSFARESGVGWTWQSRGNA